MARLSRSFDAQDVTVAVIDFEYTTPTGAPSEPIEVAVQAVHAERGRWVRGWSYEALIQPPPHAPLTAFDSYQTGITADMLADQPPADVVLADLDAYTTRAVATPHRQERLESQPGRHADTSPSSGFSPGDSAVSGNGNRGRGSGSTLVLAAHHAHAEAGILARRSGQCPTLARAGLLDTVRLAKDLFPGLPGYSLDDVADRLTIARPPGRHRAMPDVQLLVEVLIALFEQEVRWPDLCTLRAVAGIDAPAAASDQQVLF